MLATIVLILIYFTFIYFGFVQTRKLRNFLEQQGALSSETAIFVDREQYFIITTKLPFSAIKEREDGAIWVETNQWRSMIIFMTFIVGITLLTFALLILSYL